MLIVDNYIIHIMLYVPPILFNLKKCLTSQEHQSRILKRLLEMVNFRITSVEDRYLHIVEMKKDPNKNITLFNICLNNYS